MGKSPKTWLWAAACLFLLAPRGALAEKTIAFYDPDANHQAILRITAWFNAYLGKHSAGLRLQPVQSQSAFEGLLEDSNTAFAVVASSYVKKKRGRLTPLLVPAAKGSVTYRKQLIMRSGELTKNFAGKSIAATISKENRAAGAKQILSLLEKGGLSVRGASVIPVAKDIDALLALTFGQVQAALVTPRSLKVLQRINPAAASEFRSRFESRPILRSPLCMVEKRASEDEAEELVKALQRMMDDDDGRKAMTSLGFDEWREFSGDML